MRLSILIVVQDPLLRENIKASVEGYLEAEKHEVVIDGAGSVAEARKKMKRAGAKGYDLLICHVHIPEDSKTPVNTAEKRGLLFLQELEQEGVAAAGILIALDTAIFSRVQLLEDVGLVLEGTETMDEELQALCERLLCKGKKGADKKEETAPAPGGGRQQEPPRKRGKVDLVLKPNKGESIYIMEGIGFKFSPIPALLQIDTEEIEDLINRSRNVGELTEWKTELQTIGKKILKELFEKNREFYEDFRDLVRQVEGVENIRIRFIVEENIYPLALEAVLDGSGDYLMLHSPLFRTVMVNHQNRQKNEILFVDKVSERPWVNCLIIAADTWGKVVDPRVNGGREIYFARLSKVMAEAENLHGYLKDNHEKFKISAVQMVKAEPGADFSEELKKYLADNTWHLIHYAGHSYYDTLTQKGYFLYPGETGPLLVESDVLSHTLRYRNKTQFIYLSSCQSSGADFVLGLARQRIPAIIGFRWEIDDEKAARYAGLFYEKLFAENKSLPYAFLETRRKMHEDCSDNRIWAAGMLIIQGG